MGETKKSGTSVNDQKKSNAPKGTGDSQTLLKVRSKTGRPYRRLGRVWNREWTGIEVTDKEREILDGDPWLEIGD